MMIIKHALTVSLCTLGLSACMLDGGNSYTQYNEPTTAPGTTLYPESYENNVSYKLPSDSQVQTPVSSGPVVVPETYHVSAYHSPVSPKDADQSWVSSQNPQSFTIEIAQGDKASHVANVLLKAPKNERTAEVKYQRGNKESYKGFYGSYPSYEAAQQALSALPDDMKQNAGIKTWGSVQNNL